MSQYTQMDEDMNEPMLVPQEPLQFTPQQPVNGVETVDVTCPLCHVFLKNQIPGTQIACQNCGCMLQIPSNGRPPLASRDGKSVTMQYGAPMQYQHNLPHVQYEDPLTWEWNCVKACGICMLIQFVIVFINSIVQHNAGMGLLFGSEYLIFGVLGMFNTKANEKRWLQYAHFIFCVLGIILGCITAIMGIVVAAAGDECSDDDLEENEDHWVCSLARLAGFILIIAGVIQAGMYTPVTAASYRILKKGPATPILRPQVQAPQYPQQHIQHPYPQPSPRPIAQLGSINEVPLQQV